MASKIPFPPPPEVWTGPEEQRAPQCAETRYNIPGGSEVRITFNNKQTVVGTVYINPSATAVPNSIKLLRSTNETTKAFSREVSQFFGNEIAHVTLLKKYIPPYKKVETVMSMFLVENVPQLDNLISALDGETEVALSLIGERAGRTSTVSWLMICIRGNLIPVDAMGLEEVEPGYVWEKLRKPLFENKNIVKIIHDCRPVSDYLFHRRRITLTNVFDIQSCDLYLKVLNHRAKEAEAKRALDFGPVKALSLSEVCSIYIYDTILERELALMEHYYQKEIAVNGPMMKRPYPDSNARKYAALTVKYLELLKNVMEGYMNVKQRDIFDTCLRVGVENDMAESVIQYKQPEVIQARILKVIGAPRPVIQFREPRDDGNDTGNNGGPQA